MWQAIKKLFTPEPYVPTEYNVGKMFVQIEFDDGLIIKEEFIGYVTQRVMTTHGHVFTFSVLAKDVFQEWKKKLSKYGFINISDGREIPLCKIKELRTNYEDFIIEY